MADSKIPLDFWAEAACTAAHIKNRSKSTVHGKTPYEMWSGRKPNIKYVRRFDCMAYLLNKGEHKKKFDSKIVKGIFVGYAANNTYRIYIPETGRIKTDCDVKFDESKNGYELLREIEDTNRVTNKKLIVIGLEPEDVSNRMEEQEDREEQEESERTEDESSEYEDTIDESFVEENRIDGRERNENEDCMRDDGNVNEIHGQLNGLRNVGRPRGTTKAVVEVQRNQERLEQEEKLRKEGVRRSERIKNKQSVMLVKNDEVSKILKKQRRRMIGNTGSKL